MSEKTWKQMHHAPVLSQALWVPEEALWVAAQSLPCGLHSQVAPAVGVVSCGHLNLWCVLDPKDQGGQWGADREEGARGQQGVAANALCGEGFHCDPGWGWRSEWS